MGYVKWTLIAAFWLIVGSFLHYTLPRHDIVRIVNTEVRRVDFGENSLFWSNAGTGEAEGTQNRDVFFIDSIRPNGRPRVYRNEDTGWGWPPYFKLNSSNLQALAQDKSSTEAAPKWVMVRFYGWRFEPMTIYPNAVKIKSVAGPDVRIIPWFNIVFLTLLAALVFALWRRWRRFRARRIDPMLEDMEDSLFAAGDALAERRGRLRRWLDSWRG